MQIVTQVLFWAPYREHTHLCLCLSLCLSLSVSSVCVCVCVCVGTHNFVLFEIPGIMGDTTSTRHNFITFDINLGLLP